MSKWLDHILNLPPWLAVLIVFMLPAAEASIFLGFILPGEIAVVLGGVLAYQHKVSLAVVLVAAISGAIIGDSIGYFVGQKWGRRVLDSTLGRYINSEHLDRAEAFVAKRGAIAVFLGRWTAALRALIPGIAGMSDMHYRQFAIWNVIGGALWATTFVLLGNAAGSSYHHLEHQANQISYAVFGVVIVVALLAFVVVRRRKRHRITATEAD